MLNFYCKKYIVYDTVAASVVFNAEVVREIHSGTK